MFEEYTQLNLDFGIDMNNLEFSELKNNVVPIHKNEQTDTISRMFEGKEIRIAFDENINQYVFVLRDILDALGTSNHPREAKISIFQGLGEGNVVEVPLLTKGGIQKLLCVTKPAVTYLVDRSNTETGYNLRRFIHLEVLPEIEKTGGYNVNKQVDSLRQETQEFRELTNKLIRDNNEIKQFLLSLINNLTGENNEIKTLVLSLINNLTNENKEIKESLLYLTNKDINLIKTFYSLQECCDYINTKYKFINGIIVTPKMLKDYLKYIKMLKSNYTPYVKYIDNHYIDSNLNLSSFGLQYVIQCASAYMIDI